jgi:hypothetical protein
MIEHVCHHPCCSQVEKSCGCLASPQRISLLHLPLYCVLTSASDDKPLFSLLIVW